MTNYSPEHYPPKKKMLWKVICLPFLEILSQIEKLSVIKPLLASTYEYFEEVLIDESGHSEMM